MKVFPKVQLKLFNSNFNFSEANDLIHALIDSLDVLRDDNKPLIHYNIDVFMRIPHPYNQAINSIIFESIKQMTGDYIQDLTYEELENKVQSFQDKTGIFFKDYILSELGTVDIIGGKQ